MRGRLVRLPLIMPLQTVSESQTTGGRPSWHGTQRAGYTYRLCVTFTDEREAATILLACAGKRWPPGD